MLSELIRLDASTISKLIREREISCVEVVEATLDQLKLTEPQLNAFALVDEQGALGAARDIDAQLLTDGSDAPLLGAAFSVKDLIDVRGLETGCGSWLMEGTTAPEDAVAVSRLRAAGAVFIGKTTTPEFAGSVLTESPRCGITRNPWNVRHTPGGSSGGAGAALAAGCGPLALATDGAGSARIPASCCGVLGLKPTLGRVPHPQAPDLFGNFTHLSPMTRSLPDLALMLNVLSGSDSGDPWSIGRTWEPIKVKREASGLAGRVNGWYFPLLGNPRLSKAIASVCHSAITWLESEGAHIEEHDDSGLDWGIDTSRTIMRGLMSARMAQYNATQRGRMGASMRTAITQGEKMSADAMKAAPIARAYLYRQVETLLEKKALILSPTLSAPPPLADIDPVGAFEVDGHAVGDLRSGWFTYPTPFNLTGHPAISIPIGFDDQGLPVGLQAVARWGQEQLLFDLASVLQERFSWAEHWPSAVGFQTSSEIAN